MLVLLPPSEGKTAPRRGKPADLAALAFADVLTSPRKRVLDAYDPALLDSAPSARASAVYTGVLYQRLGLPSLPAASRRRVLIFSALWGVVRPDDRIPAYKLPAGTNLPALDSGLAALWRPLLGDALPDAGLVLDLRSGSYSSFWTPRSAKVVSVRAFTADGKVISHMVKATRGDVARIVLSQPAASRPKRPADVAELVAATGRDVTLSEVRGGGWTLDVTEGS